MAEDDEELQPTRAVRLSTTESSAWRWKKGGGTICWGNPLSPFGAGALRRLGRSLAYEIKTQEEMGKDLNPSRATSSILKAQTFPR